MAAEPVAEPQADTAVVATPAAEPALVWLENYDEALKSAAELKRPILIYFTGSDWCHYCNAFEKTILSKPDFITYVMSTFVLLKADFPINVKQSAELEKQNQTLAAKYGYEYPPYIALTDSAGKQFATSGFYQGAGVADYIEHFKELIAKQL